MKEKFEIVDFHSHILPGADHGSSSLETSLTQLKYAAESGIKNIVATPHFYPHAHTVDSFIAKRDAAYESLAPHIPDGMNIKLGAEVLICKGIENLPGLDKLFLDGTNTLLLELSFSDFSADYPDSVQTLIKNGVNVVLAHADRYDPELIEQMLMLGAKIQLNATALNTVFKKKTLYDWLSRGVVVALGSDIHGADKNAYPTLVKAYKKIGVYAEKVQNESLNILKSSLNN